ncbi:hypothetical protein R0595_001286 [Pluralibacter gergoviae]|nr:hypothetical protein [Pluralibacter gergoviae]ELW9440308.1 hypothetical protein [Pluralibacter gergoviae]
MKNIYTKSWDSDIHAGVAAQEAEANRRIKAEQEEAWLKSVSPKDITFITPEKIDIDAFGDIPEQDLKAELQRKYFPGLKRSQQRMNELHKQIEQLINDVIGHNEIMMELSTNLASYCTRLDRDGYGFSPAEMLDVINQLPEGSRMLTATPAIRNPRNASLIIADKSQEGLEQAAKEILEGRLQKRVEGLKSTLRGLIANHQQLAKQYRKELAEIQRFDDLLSVSREISKAV